MNAVRTNRELTGPMNMQYQPRQILELLDKESSIEFVVRYLRANTNLWPQLSPSSAEIEFIGMLDFDRAWLSNSREVRLLEVLWQLRGPSEFLQHDARPLGHTKFIEAFLTSKLNDPKVEFDLLDLQLIARICPNLGKVTSERIAQGFVKHVQKMDWAPPDFDNDIQKVSLFVSSYNFPVLLSDCLLEVERGLDPIGSGFDFKVALTHLRTFFEHLHKHVAVTLRNHDPSAVDGTDLTSCGQTLELLHRKELVTDKMKALGIALYGFLSEQGVHSMTSTQEHVRLCRNMVAEYALVLFAELDRRIGETAGVQ
jgi:hypothetical protein